MTIYTSCSRRLRRLRLLLLSPHDGPSPLLAADALPHPHQVPPAPPRLLPPRPAPHLPLQRDAPHLAPVNASQWRRVDAPRPAVQIRRELVGRLDPAGLELVTGLTLGGGAVPESGPRECRTTWAPRLRFWNCDMVILNSWRRILDFSVSRLPLSTNLREKG